MSLPDKCPFCGAAIAVGDDGKKRVADLCVIFDCGSGFHELMDPIRTRSRACKAITRVTELEARCKRLEEAGDAIAKAASPFVLTEIEEGFDGDPVPMDSVGEDYEITYDSPPTAGDHVAMDLARKAWRNAKEAKP